MGSDENLSNHNPTLLLNPKDSGDPPVTVPKPPITPDHPRDVINAHDLQYHQYADDLQLYTAVRADDFQDLSHVESCVADVSRWFLQNSLLLNPTKTEAVVFGTRPRLHSIDLSQHLNIEGASIQIAESVRLLGVTLDQTLSFDQHVSEVVRSCNYHLRALRHIRPRLTMECAKSVATSIVGSRLDYCNSLLHGMAQKKISRLCSTVWPELSVKRRGRLTPSNSDDRFIACRSDSEQLISWQ